MKKTVRVLTVIILCILFFPSCRREDLSIRDCEARTIVDENGITFLEVFLSADIPDVMKTQMTVKDPSGNLIWSVNPEKITVDGLSYIGSRNIAVPKGFVIPSGKWIVELIYRDGRTVSRTFNLVSDSSSDQTE